MPELIDGVRGRYGEALGSTLLSATVPYGYTVTIWSSGALLIHKHGTPNLGAAFLFVAGALAGFATLAALASRRRSVPTGQAPRSVLAAGLHVVAVGMALGVVALTELIPSLLAWSATAYAATTIYLGVASLQLALSEEVTHRRLLRRSLLDGDAEPESVIERALG